MSSEAIVEKPKCWWKFLQKKRISMQEWIGVRDWSRSWVTCACGERCKRVPRDQFGMPKDDKLRRLGIDFHRAIISRKKKRLHHLQEKLLELQDAMSNFAETRKVEAVMVAAMVRTIGPRLAETVIAEYNKLRPHTEKIYADVLAVREGHVDPKTPAGNPGEPWPDNQPNPTPPAAEGEPLVSDKPWNPRVTPDVPPDHQPNDP